MDIYKNYIIVFGGSSAYNKTSKMRVCNKEIHVFDIYKQKWLTDFAKPSREVFTPRQRMYHASAVYGECLVVHGGINTDDKSVYDDIFLFNIQQQSWIGLSESKSLIELLGARHMHTMTVVLPFNLTGKEQEALWQTTPNTPSSILSSEFWGIYLFGGYKEGFGQTNDLWLIRPILRAKPEGKSQLKKLQDTDAYSLEAIKLEPEGRPPVSRVLHSTVFFKNQYLIIYGGKSEEIYTSTKNLALNDVCIYDIPNNKWEKLIMYGFHPNSRWGHCMTVFDKNQIVIFGGVNLNNYCDISLSILNIPSKISKTKDESSDESSSKNPKPLKDFLRKLELLSSEVKSKMKSFKQ